jgi:hypothetical protein
VGPQTAGRRRLTPSHLISDGAVGNTRPSEVIKKQKNKIFLLFVLQTTPQIQSHTISRTNNSSRITYNTTNIHNSSFHMKHTFKFTKSSPVHKLKHKFTSSHVHKFTSSQVHNTTMHSTRKTQGDRLLKWRRLVKWRGLI